MLGLHDQYRFRTAQTYAIKNGSMLSNSSPRACRAMSAS